ncbi:MAG: hypothetical protein CMK92_02360 [Pseudomonas sp.]|nr:hypothetical protein [Pseudomonas sp.]
MGVRTTCWGPHAWKCIHSVADWLDKHGTKTQRRIFFINLQYVLPCIHCRRSYGKFLIDLRHEGASRWSARFLAYRIHQCVNAKLRAQGHKIDEPRFEDLPRYRSIRQRDTLAFMRYAMMDYDKKRWRRVVTWITNVCSMVPKWNAAWPRAHTTVASYRSTPLERVRALCVLNGTKTCQAKPFVDAVVGCKKNGYGCF